MRRIWVWSLALLLVVLAGCASATQTSQTTPAPTATPAGPKTMWIPAAKTTWQWQLDTKPLDTTIAAQMFDIDGFNHTAAEVAQLHAQGRKVVCYISVGSWENFRHDAGQFPASVLGKPLDGFPDERWLDIRQISVLGPIMEQRMDMCRAKGFDAIEPDNVDGYTNTSGFPLTAQDQLAYNQFIAQQAHARGLSVGLKNDLDQIPQLIGDFDWALNEQCFEYQECDALRPFVTAHKAVFQVEYNLKPENFCPQANQLGFNSMRKHLALDAYRVPCWGS